MPTHKNTEIKIPEEGLKGGYIQKSRDGEQGKGGTRPGFYAILRQIMT
jgi:hypothetical protein